MANASILIADDDEHVRAVLSDILTEADHCVVAAPDGPTAVREAGSQRFDITFIDVHMPNQDGVETLRAIRTVAPSTRCVMISGVRDPELAETCRRLGAQACIWKPLELQEIVKLVDDLVRPDGALFSWEEGTEEEQAPAPAERPDEEPEQPAPAASAPGTVPAKGVRLRDPCAVLRSAENGEVLARVACTVYAALDAGGRCAREWGGAVDDFHLSPAAEPSGGQAASGTLVLRDAVHGLFAGDATLRGREIVAAGPLHHKAPLLTKSFRVGVRKAPKDPSVTLVEPDGDLSGAHVRKFADALRRATRNGRSRIVVQLDGLSFIDSAAVKTCLRLVQQLRARNGDLKIAGAKGDIWRIIEAVGAHRTLSCFATDTDAVTSFAHDSRFDRTRSGA
jgi:anti-anti-sigma factor